MKRSEMDPRFQWDFTHIYPDKAHWEAAMTEAEKAVEALSALHGTLGQSKDALKKGLEQLADASQKVEIPYIYAMLHRAADGSEPAYQEMEARGMSLAVKANAATSFLDPEILAIPKEQLDAWMAQEDMAVYRHMVEDISRGRAHTLSADKEKMLAMLGEAADTPSSAYEMLTNVNMVFPKIHNEAGGRSPAYQRELRRISGKPQPGRSGRGFPGHVRYLPQVRRYFCRTVRRADQV